MQQSCIEGRQGRTTPRGSASAYITGNWRATASDAASLLHIHDTWQLIEAIDAAAIDGVTIQRYIRRRLRTHRMARQNSPTVKEIGFTRKDGVVF